MKKLWIIFLGVFLLSLTIALTETSARQCSYSTECPNGGNPIAIDGTHSVQYVCTAGQCIESAPITTDCTNNEMCVAKYGNGYVCDLSINNFGKCITQTKPYYCGDGTCTSLDGETVNTCPQDCSLNNEIIPNDNSSNNIYIIACAVIIGFIILAIVVKSRRN
jgi:hypothetical protein